MSSQDPREARQLESEVLPVELEYVQQRRAAAESEGRDPQAYEGQPSTGHDLVGLAFSGGGVRSATVNLGILQALHKRGILPHVDYLSTVSGGGFIGSCLTALLSEPGRRGDPDPRGTFPFALSDGPREPPALEHLRDTANYLEPAGALSWMRGFAVWFRGLLINLTVLVPLIFLLAVAFAYWRGDDLRKNHDPHGVYAELRHHEPPPLPSRPLGESGDFFQVRWLRFWSRALGQPVADADADGVFDFADPDVDGDGLPNLRDPDFDGSAYGDRPEPRPGDLDGDGVPDAVDLDPDGDGTPDNPRTAEDETPARDTLGSGCAQCRPLPHPWRDNDGDGRPDYRDPDMDGDRIDDDRDSDMDGDGILDIHDPDMDGDGWVNHFDSDMDGDGDCNHLDADMDGDGIHDVADHDMDGDGVPNFRDEDLDGDGEPNSRDGDLDGDGIPNAFDHDRDGDGVVDTYDPDTDSDGWVDAAYISSASGGVRIAADDRDLDDDGVDDAHDPDTDGDGIPDVLDLDPDLDGDGIPNSRDLDIDGDGTPNAKDIDLDGDGTPNVKDADMDGDSLPNIPDPDMDGDGIEDFKDADMDGDAVPNGEDPDMDGDGVWNLQDFDADGDGLADVFTLDFDNDGSPDHLDAHALGERDLRPHAFDSDSDGILDHLEPGDVDEDGVADYLADWTDGRASDPEGALRSRLSSPGELRLWQPARFEFRLLGWALTIAVVWLVLFLPWSRLYRRVYRQIHGRSEAVSSWGLSWLLRGSRARVEAGSEGWLPGLRDRYERSFAAAVVFVVVAALLDVQPAIVHAYHHWEPSTSASEVLLIVGAGVLLLGLLKVGKQLALLLIAASGPLFLYWLFLDFASWLSYCEAAEVPHWEWTLLAAVVLGGASLLFAWSLDINDTSIHSYYRDCLARTFVISQRNGEVKPSRDIRLSTICPEGSGAPYHLLNTTLNLQGSAEPLRGRKADFFCLSKHFAGSRSTGYCRTAHLEEVFPFAHLSAAMATSGAAAAPNMGISTWAGGVVAMVLLNVRLGFWLPNPRRIRRAFRDVAEPAGDVSLPATRSWAQRWRVWWLRHTVQPTTWLLTRELLSRLRADANCVNLSDGAHIENTGVYELLRRRCRFIIACDAEADPAMTFEGLATVIRYARIDMGIEFHTRFAGLLPDAQGHSQQHCAFARIDYPPLVPGGEREAGCMLVVKSTLTGDEDQVVRRYRAESPDFPHESTADQFFTESQFEAYRALGVHMLDSVLPHDAIGREFAELEAWFQGLEARLQPAERGDRA